MTHRRLKILVLSPGLPLPNWGMGTRIYQLARHLAGRHDVSMVTYAPESDAGALDALRGFCRDLRLVAPPHVGSLGRRVQQVRSAPSPAPFLAREFFSDTMQAAVDAVLADHRFDVVQLEGSQMCCFRLRTNAPVVLDEHNIEYELLKRMQQGERSRARRAHHGLEARKVRRLEYRWWQEVDAVAVTSRREELIVRHQAPATPTAVVRNGVDLSYFSPDHGTLEPEPDRIVFTGLMTYRPNIDAALFLVNEILPRLRRLRPQVTLTVVGDGRAGDLALLRQPGVSVTGWVRDVRPYLRGASVVVAPLRIGGGTRLKVVEALAMAKPLVTTTIGCEGLDVRHGTHLLVADDADQFARDVAQLLADPEKGRVLGAAGREVATRSYSWDGAARELEDLYARLTLPARGFNRGAPMGASRVA